MAKKTSFEQVPLEVVKAVEEEANRKETTESGRGTKNEELENSVGGRRGQWESQKNAIHLVDIFKLEVSGPLWVGSAATVEDAKCRVQELASVSPAEYLLRDLRTGDKLVIQPDRGDSPLIESR